MSESVVELNFIELSLDELSNIYSSSTVLEELDLGVVKITKFKSNDNRKFKTVINAINGRSALLS